MIMLGWDYFEGHEAYENLWKGINYILILIMLWLPDDLLNNCPKKRGIAAFILVSSWHMFFKALSKHPHLFFLRRSLAMITKVFITFSKYFITYAYIVMTFACGFYIIMHQDYLIPIEGTNEDTETYYYNGTWRSLVKVNKIHELITAKYQI